MKIGILTWYFGMNHGARAHSYALMKVVQQFGYECQMIAYKPYKEYLQEPGLIWSRNPFKLLGRFIYRWQFWQGEACYNKSIVIRDPSKIDSLKYNLIILGSDEIFNINHPLTRNDWSYFGVGIEDTPLITYAVSCGQTSPDTIWDKKITESIEKINSLSVRDFNTQNLILSNTGRTSELVLDPTMLYDFSRETDKNWNIRDYILIYAFSGANQYEEEIQAHAVKHHLKIVFMGGVCKWADICFPHPIQSEWYASFYFADLVITDSFHGTIFALKNKKNFVLISLYDKQTKIENLLRAFDIDYGSRLLIPGQNNVIDDISLPDYKAIDKTIFEKKETSLNWLRTQISKFAVGDS